MTRVIGDVDNPLVEKVAREEIIETALELIESEEPVVIVSDGAWRLYLEARREAERLGLNWLLLEAVDPLEAHLAAIPLEQLIAARHTLASIESRVSAPAIPVLEKRVSRRELLRSLGSVALTYRDTAVIVNPQVCSNPGCPLCTRHCPYNAIVLEDDNPRVDDKLCRGCGACLSACPFSNISLHSSNVQKLWDYLSMLRGPPGIAVYACRASIAELLDGLRDKNVSRRIVIVPINCPGEATLELLLATHLHSLTPIIYCPRASRDCGAEGVKEYASTVLESYARIVGTSEPPVASKPDEVLEAPEYIQVLEDYETLPASLGEAARIAAARILSKRGVREPVRIAAPLQAELRVSEKCTLCGACVNMCPANALRIETEDDEMKLVVYPLRCIGCPVCARICPENAIEAHAAALPTTQPYTLHADEIVKCKVCGRPLGPRKLIEKTVEMLKAKGAPQSVIEAVYLCEECKRKRMLGLLEERKS